LGSSGLSAKSGMDIGSSQRKSQVLGNRARSGTF